jgi:mannose-6-phosphate isomerase-like protein (cupin superfamily)
MMKLLPLELDQTLEFASRALREKPDAIAPDGSEVRLLAASQRGSMAQFSLPPGKISVAVCHRTVEELWYFTGGTGKLWRKAGKTEETIEVHQGVSISIPVGTHFQFRCDSATPLQAVGVTMPPWPGTTEAFAVPGIWNN